MSRWFRFYSDALRNPKVARLSDKDFRTWVALLSIASENNGTIPGLDDLVLMLRERRDYAERALKRLCDASLLDLKGDGYEPHNWSTHQYKSDTSTDRVHKHRGKRNVSETPPETEADTETEAERKKRAQARELDREFEDQFWPQWPSRTNKEAAKKAYPKARSLADLAQIIEGVRRYRVNKPDDRAWMHAATFLNGKRWNDEYSSPPARAGPRQSGDPFGNAINSILENENAKRDHEVQGASAGGAEPRDREPRGGLFEPIGASSGGDYLDLRPVYAERRG